MAGIKDYSTTAANNTAINSISIAEGCAPSGINDAIRQEMADTRSFYESGGWIDLGYTHTYASSTSVTVSGQDVTTKYPAGRRIRAVGSSTGTIYGKVASSSFSTNTTINFTWDSGSLSNEALTVSVGFLNVTGYPIDVTAVKGAGAGTVTSIVAGTGLTGGTITSSGTIAVDYSTTNTWTGVNTYSKALRGTPVALTSSSASIATDASAGNFFTHTFTENTTLANPSNLAAGQEGIIVFTQHASSPKTLAFGSYWKFSGGTVPSVTATNSAVDVLVYYVESSTRITAKLLTDVK